MVQIIDALLLEVREELFHYPVFGKKENIKYCIKRIIRRKNTPKRDRFFWPHALLTQALESAGREDVLEEYYGRWYQKGMELKYPDHVMNGFSLLYLYEKTGKEIYKKMADKIYEYILSYSLSMGNPMPYRKNHPVHIYVDLLGMAVPFLARYGALFQNEQAMELGISQIEAFLQYGMDKGTGLPYHGYDKRTGEKQGIIGWGRAAGWLLLAMADSMEYFLKSDTLESERKEKMIEACGSLFQASLKYIREDGYVSWQLSAMEGPADTSATAMIGYALIKAEWDAKSIGKKQNKTKEENIFLTTIESVRQQDGGMEKKEEKIKEALLRSGRQGKVFQCSGECHGFSEYPQHYGSYPWSVGPTARFLLLYELCQR